MNHISSESANALYLGCKDLPVFDYHTHISPREVYENTAVRDHLRSLGVTALCTDEDPASNLDWYKKLRGDLQGIRVIPTFCPDRLLNACADGWTDAVRELGRSEGMEISALDDLKEALRRSHVRFASLGSRSGAHNCPWMRVFDPAGAEQAFENALRRGTATPEEADAIASALLLALGERYWNTDMVMHFHADASCMAALLNALGTHIPHMVLHCLREGEYAQVLELAAGFAENRVQIGWLYGSADAYRTHLNTLMERGMFASAIGAFTDACKTDELARHDEMRRILCDVVGQAVERGIYSLPQAQEMVHALCGKNAVTFFAG